MSIRTVSIVSLALLAGAAASNAQQLTTQRIATGLFKPVFVTAPPGDTSRIFIVEQRGSGGMSTQAQIKILNLATNSINATPFLTINPVGTGAEQGLLSMVFDPNYASNGRFFICYTNTANGVVIQRYIVSADPNIADSTTGLAILTQPKSFNNHNGGWMGFGPDGYLYVGMGDGGSEYDPNGQGQSLTTLFGKILRIDVSAGGPGYTIPPTNPFFGSATNRQEIWAYGLRNPWRPAFDRLTGDFWIADVGQDFWEEIDFQPRTFDPPFTAVNYGWRCYEGNAVQNSTIGPSGTSCSTISNFKFPIYTYAHTPACSVSGGYVYRGCAMPYLRGTYFFADWCSNQISSLQYNGVTATNIVNRTAELANPGQTINAVVSFGEDASGELYICDQSGGEIYKIIPRCSVNCDGSSTAPILNANDFQCYLNTFASGDCYANCDGSSTNPTLNANDFQCFLNKYAAGCS